MDKATNYAGDYYSAINQDHEALKKNVDDFPVSSLAQFLLLYHYKISNDSDFKDLAKQTAPYLSNSFWIEYQLFQAENSTHNNSINIPDSKNPGEEKVSFEDSKNEMPSDEIQQTLRSEFHTENEQDGLPVNEVLKEIPETSEEENIEAAAENQEGELPVQVNEEIMPISNSESNSESETIEEEGRAVRLEENMVAASPQSTVVSTESEENNDSLKEREEEKIEEEKSVNEIEIPEVHNVDSSEKNLNVSNFSEENDEEEDLFEPLHTVDYFASQGIKISENALNDNLGKQVKSFTAWLKSMKKLHPGQIPEQNEVVERLIQASSEVSNQNANVLTEAMAEVLVKQGKQEKAIEMYQKLSLLNPSKSAYFAAKIESLKTV